jgi:hypothetical protein
MGYRIVRMTRELFEQMFVEGYTLPTEDHQRIRVTKGLPQGAKLDAVSMDVFFDSNGIALRFSHPEWSEEPFGIRIAEERIEYRMETTTEFRQWMFNDLSYQELAQLAAEANQRLAEMHEALKAFDETVPASDDEPHVAEGR